MTDYERGYKDGMAGAALPNIVDNGDKIDGYNYSYKTDSEGVPYINIDCVRAMLAKATQPVDRWISVDEALPENDADCLVWYKCDTAFGKSESWGIANCSRCDWYTKHLHGDNIVVLYWQSMPEPPKTKKE